MLDSFAKLKKLKEKGYLFHGSFESDLKELVPSQTSDSQDPQGWNVDKAVFATDKPAAAIIFSLINLEELEGSKQWSVGWEGQKVITKLPMEWCKVVEKAIGYVYVLKPEHFSEELENQFKSKVSVKPVQKVRVTLSDYFLLGGILKKT